MLYFSLSKIKKGAAYFIFLLRKYCFSKTELKFNFLNFIKLVLVIITIFGISFGPFIYLGQLKNLLNRLFPFQRGLLHSYWAPNIWALYSFIDKSLKLFFKISKSQNVSSLGITQETSFDFLPRIPPSFTILLILTFLIPLFYTVWKNPKRKYFLNYLAYAIFVFFLFGYHVHEKAILMVLIIYQANIFNEQKFSLEIMLFLRITSGISLFPLLIRINGIFTTNFNENLKKHQ